MDSKYDSKKHYIMAKWQQTFPDDTDLTYDQITRLASSVKLINEWYVEATNEFIQIKEAPEWLSDAGGDPIKWSDEVASKIKLSKNKLQKLSKEIQIKSEAYQKEVEELTKHYDDSVTQMIKDTPEVAFSLMNSSVLDYKIHIIADTKSSSEEKKEYLRKELNKFIVDKYKLYVNGDLKVNDLLDILRLKL